MIRGPSDKKQKSLKTRGSRGMPPRILLKPTIKMAQSGNHDRSVHARPCCRYRISTLQSEQYALPASSNLWQQPAKATSLCFLSSRDHDHLFAHVLSMSLTHAAPCVTISTRDISFGRTRISRKTFKGSPHGRNSQKWRQSSLAYTDISREISFASVVCSSSAD